MWDLRSMFYQNMPVARQQAQHMKLITEFIQNFQSTMPPFMFINPYSFDKYVGLFLNTEHSQYPLIVILSEGSLNKTSTHFLMQVFQCLHRTLGV